MRGQQQAAERQMHMLAWHAANVMNPHLKKGNQVSPDKLLGKKEVAKEDPLTTMRRQKKAAADKLVDEAALLTQPSTEFKHISAKMDAWMQDILQEANEETWDGDTLPEDED